MSDTRELVARLACELYNVAVEKGHRDMQRAMGDIYAEARAPEEGQVARGNDGEATEDDHTAAGSFRGAPPSPAPAAADEDVETVRRALRDWYGFTHDGPALDALDRLAARLAELQTWRDRAVAACNARRCTSRERELADLTNRLAQFEALAEEAHRAVSDTMSSMHVRRGRRRRITRRLAALAKEA